VDIEFAFLKDIDDPPVKSTFFIDNADLVILNQIVKIGHLAMGLRNCHRNNISL
jgi:hypothetical protein